MVFSIPSYLCTGDRPKRVVDERAKGATFIVSAPKSGHNPDALFDHEFHYMWNGERGTDAATLTRRQQMESSKKNLTANGFAYTGPTRRPEGLGSYFGCFQSSPYPYIPPHPQTHDAAAKKELPMRGIYTSPGKKGTGYGYANLALSNIGAEYFHSFYDQPRINARRERAEWARKMPAEPMKPAGREGYTFDESPATGASRCYIMTVPFRPKRPVRDIPHLHIDQIWRPAGYVDDKPTRMEYWEDPYDGYDPRKGPRSRVKKPLGEPFRPSSYCDNFWYTQSIVFKRL